jgi:cytochrome P450
MPDQVAYEQQGHATIEDWLAKLAELDGSPIDTSLYALLIPFDNIGRVGFSSEFGMVRSGRETELLRLLGVGLAAAGKLGQMGWPIGVLRSLGLTTDEDKLDVYLNELIGKRIANDSPDKQDIMSAMLADMRAPAPRSITSHGVLVAEVGAILGGGTDTIGVVLAYAFYYLAASKARQEALRATVAPAYGVTTRGRFADRDLEPLADLTAFVDEILRLHSPACNNGSRTVPAGGLTIGGDGDGDGNSGGVHVPGGASVYVPIHSLQTDARYFEEPLVFVPERWTTRPDLVRDRRAFHPFLVGPYNCVGKRLALRFVRLVLASTLRAYDVEFAAGEDGRAVHDEAVNRLILKPGPLWCVFKTRAGQET